MKTKALKMLCLILAVCLLAFFGKTEGVFRQTSANPSSSVIILDAGHGGFDGGAVAKDGTVEKDINLKICLKLASLLKSSGYNVILTRETDVSTDDVETDKIPSRKKSDLRNRLKLMKDFPNSVFVSIHLNKFTTAAASGAQIFYSEKEEESKILAEDIRKSIVSMLQKDNTRVNKKSTSSTYILHNATVPAVLVECGFLSNSEELKKLKNSEYQNQMAFTIFCGITKYFSKGTI
jgi:N-acetylmuramoyl-L-alanine amidase